MIFVIPGAAEGRGTRGTEIPQRSRVLDVPSLPRGNDWICIRSRGRYGNHHPRLRRADRAEGGADPRPGRLRQIAAGLGSAASGGARRPALRAPGGGRPRPCGGMRGPIAGAPSRGAGRPARNPRPRHQAPALRAAWRRSAWSWIWRPRMPPGIRNRRPERPSLAGFACRGWLSHPECRPCPWCWRSLSHPPPAIDLRPASGLTPLPLSG